MGKSNSSITLPDQKATIMARPIINTSHIVNPQYKILLYAFFKEKSRMPNAGTLKVY